MSLGQPFMDFPHSETDMETETENELFEVEDIRSKFIGLFKNNRRIENVAMIKDYSQEDEHEGEYASDPSSPYPEQGLRDKEKSRGNNNNNNNTRKKKTSFDIPTTSSIAKKFENYPTIDETEEFNEENISKVFGKSKNGSGHESNHISGKFQDYPSLAETMEFNEKNLSTLMKNSNTGRRIETPKPINLVDAPFMKGIASKIQGNNNNHATNSQKNSDIGRSTYEEEVKRWKFDCQRKTFCSRFESLSTEEKRKYKSEVDRVNSMFKNGERPDKITNFINNEARFIEKHFSSRLLSSNKNDALSWKANLMDLANSSDYNFIYE